MLERISHINFTFTLFLLPDLWFKVFSQYFQVKVVLAKSEFHHSVHRISEEEY